MTRTWEKIKAALQARLATEPDPQRRRSVERALGVGLPKLRAEQAALAGTGPGPDQTLLRVHAHAATEVLAPIRRQLGLDDTTWPLTGAAPVPIDVLASAESDGGIEPTNASPNRARWAKLTIEFCPVPNTGTGFASDTTVICAGVSGAVGAPTPGRTPQGVEPSPPPPTASRPSRRRIKPTRLHRQTFL